MPQLNLVPPPPRPEPAEELAELRELFAQLAETDARWGDDWSAERWRRAADALASRAR